MRPSILLPALALVLVPAAVQAQEVNATVSIGQPAAGAQTVAPPPPQTQPVYVQPQPVYGPPPAYGQPVYAQPYVMPRRRRIVTEYHGGPIPPGAVLETRRMTGLAIAGGVTFGVFYIISALTAGYCTGDPTCNPAVQWMYVPVLGPFITMTDSRVGAGDRTLEIFDGIVQTAGLLSLVLGLAVTHQELVMWGSEQPNHNRRPQWAVLPTAAGAPAGLTLSVANF